MKFGFDTRLWIDLFTGEFVLQDNNWINGLWGRECKDQYFYVGVFSEKEEAHDKNGKLIRIRTVWKTK